MTNEKFANSMYKCRRAKEYWGKVMEICDRRVLDSEQRFGVSETVDKKFYTILGNLAHRRVNHWEDKRDRVLKTRFGH